jgi:hypothetical protein
MRGPSHPADLYFNPFCLSVFGNARMEVGRRGESRSSLQDSTGSAPLDYCVRGARKGRVGIELRVKRVGPMEPRATVPQRAVAYT